MQNLLEDLYLGSLRPSDQVNPQCGEYREVRAKRSEKINRLTERLKEIDPTLKRELMEIVDMEGDEDYYEMVEAFTVGFRLGARVMLSALEDD
ncbi:MAG: DUF6809 family protein [Oscillospiraceae bacterium]